MLHAEYKVTVESALPEVLSGMGRLESIPTWPLFSRTGAVRFEQAHDGTSVTFLGVLEQEELVSLAETAVRLS